MRDREKNLKEFPVRDLRGVVNHLYGFSVTSVPTAHLFIGGARNRSASISGDCVLHTLHVVEHCLDAPEASPRKYGGVFTSYRCGLDGNCRRNGSRRS